MFSVFPKIAKIAKPPWVILYKGKEEGQNPNFTGNGMLYMDVNDVMYV